jgi:hypothetical protein
MRVDVPRTLSAVQNVLGLQTGTGSALRTPTAIATALPKGWSGGLQTGTETASMIGRKTNMVAPIVLRV